MINYKHLIIGSVATLTLIGCGGTSTTAQETELRESLSARMMDIGQNLSNEEAVQKDFEALTLPKYINGDYTLQSEGIAGSDINWSLLNSGDFNITGSTLMIEDRSIEQYAKLSAFINYDLNTTTLEANQTKEFCLTVLPKVTDSCDKVNQDITMIEGNLFPITIDLNATAPFKDCRLLATAPNDSNITWKICDNEFLEINATTNTIQVVNPELITEKICATVQATFQNGEIEKDAYFDVVILPQ